MTMLTSLSNIPQSKWTVRNPNDKHKVEAAKSGDIVDVTEVSVSRLWVQQHRRVQNVVDKKAWSLTEAVA